ncbi:MAG: response regulator [Acidimicrobiales bacterium]
MADLIIASDSPALRSGVGSVLDPAVTVREATSAREVLAMVTERAPDLVVADLQMGSMGGIATCRELRLEESGGRLPRIGVLLLLDRRPDVFLARRSGAEGWVVKPLDPLRLRRAVDAVLAGGTFFDPSYLPAGLTATGAGAEAVG